MSKKNISYFHITNSTELNATQNATSCFTAEEILSILCNPAGEGPYRIHKSLSVS
jgi:hypothetical protein